MTSNRSFYPGHQWLAFKVGEELRNSLIGGQLAGPNTVESRQYIPQLDLHPIERQRIEYLKRHRVQDDLFMFRDLAIQENRRVRDASKRGLDQSGRRHSFLTLGSREIAHEIPG